MMDTLRFRRETYRPRELLMHVHYKLRLSGFNLAEHLLLHFPCMRCLGSNIVRVDVVGSGAAMGVQVDFWFRAEDSDTTGRCRMVAHVAGQCRRCFKTHKRSNYSEPAAPSNPPETDQ